MKINEINNSLKNEIINYSFENFGRSLENLSLDFTKEPLLNVFSQWEKEKRLAL